MKKLILIATLAAMAFSSCLKDNIQAVDFSKAGNIVNFPQSGLASFGSDALTQDTSIVKFATDYATANANPALTVTLAVDQTLTDKYNAANTAIAYLPMPTSAYTLSSTTVNIPAGKQYAFTTLTVYKNTLDPAKSYMLPIKIASANGVAISANQSIHYFHVIGNPFAGSYNQVFLRYNGYNSPPPPGTSPSGGSITTPSPITIFPVSPTQFQVTTGYIGNVVNYEVTFTQVDPTHYKNFQISFNATDVANDLTASNIAVIQQPVFGYGVTPAYDPNTVYTYAQALSYFTFQYVVQNSSGFRYAIDTYTHN